MSAVRVREGLEGCTSAQQEINGIRKAADPVERARRETRVGRLQTLLGTGLPLNDAAADAYGRVCGLVLANGRRVRGRAIDLMIAATAAAHGAEMRRQATPRRTYVWGHARLIA